MVPIEFAHVVHDVVHLHNTFKVKLADLSDLEEAFELMLVYDLDHVFCYKADTRSIDRDQFSAST